MYNKALGFGIALWLVVFVHKKSTNERATINFKSMQCLAGEEKKCVSVQLKLTGKMKGLRNRMKKIEGSNVFPFTLLVWSTILVTARNAFSGCTNILSSTASTSASFVDCEYGVFFNFETSYSSNRKGPSASLQSIQIRKRKGKKQNNTKESNHGYAGKKS